MLLHLVAHVARRSVETVPSFADPDVSDRLWLGLRAAFPSAVAACIVPSHVHLVLPVVDGPGRPGAGRSERGSSVSSRQVDGVSSRAAHLLVGALSSALGGAALRAVIPGAPAAARAAWAPVTCRAVEDSVEGCLSVVSHVHFRPCRLGHVRDPLAWPWSTHRDLVGARIDPWLGEARFSHVLGLDERERRDALRALVGEGAKPRSGVLSVAPQSTRRPELPELVRGADAACLYAPRALRSSVAVHLARAYGYADLRLVARAVGISLGSAERIARSEPPSGLDAAELCALDARLTFRPTRSALLAG